MASLSPALSLALLLPATTTLISEITSGPYVVLPSCQDAAYCSSPSHDSIISSARFKRSRPHVHVSNSEAAYLPHACSVLALVPSSLFYPQRIARQIASKFLWALLLGWIFLDYKLDGSRVSTLNVSFFTSAVVPKDYTSLVIKRFFIVKNA